MRRDVFQAIADPVRRDIIGLLARQSLTVKSIAENFEISRPAISRHLKILKECGLVAMRQQGRERFCNIQAKQLNEVSEWVEQYRKLWEPRLDAFEEYLNALQQQKITEMEDLKDRTLTLQRTLSAPRKLVWEAWTQAGHIASWWAPKGMKTEVKELDFKPGGKWEYVMTAPNGTEFPTEGVYIEIVEYEKIVCTGNFGSFTRDVVLTALFEDAGDKTLFTFSVEHKTAAYCKEQEEMGAFKGWGGVFAGLESYLLGLEKK